MFSAKSLGLATLGIIVGFYILDNYMPGGLLGARTASITPVRTATATDTYTP